MSHCSVDGCSNKYYGAGLCNKHYIRQRRYGTTEPGVRPRGGLVERFLRRLVVGDKNACWEWPSGRKRKWYGVIQEGGKGSRLLLAHRVSYEYHKGGPIPNGMLVLHSCDNPPCVNPNHLRLGTYSENTKEARR